MARAQRKSDERAARWQELEPLRRLVTAAPIRGPGGSAAVISVDQSGARWLSPLNPDGSIGPGGPVELLRLLVTEAIWLVVFRRSYTVQVARMTILRSRPTSGWPARWPPITPPPSWSAGSRTASPPRCKAGGRNFGQHPYRLWIASDGFLIASGGASGSRRPPAAQGTLISRWPACILFPRVTFRSAGALSYVAAGGDFGPWFPAGAGVLLGNGGWPASLCGAVGGRRR